MSRELASRIGEVLADKGPARVAQLRAELADPAPVAQVLKALASLQRIGQASRDMTGRWSLTPTGKQRFSSPVGGPAVRSAEIPPLPVVADNGLQYSPGGTARIEDPSQDRVIEADPEERLLVEAGPGFGKTDVACARVAWLIEEAELEPESILLLSFTRTAVREMRARIAQLARGVRSVGGVEIRTLDSFSWRLRVGSTEVVTPATHRMDFDQSIAGLLAMLEDPSDELLEYIERFEHVFVDEAQDLTGDRARLVARFLNLLPESSGFTVFLDPAQAIYGWEDEEDDDIEWTWQELVSALDPGPTLCRLDFLHRTRDLDLRLLLLGSRELILNDKVTAPERRVHAELLEKAGPRKPIGDTMKELGEFLQANPEAFILFRTRAEALEASSWLAGTVGVPHRLRFGGLPQTAAAWLAVVINDCWQRQHGHIIDERLFAGVWRAVGATWVGTGWTAERAWRTLRRMGPLRGNRQAVDLKAVADRLAMNQLPDELFLKDVGPTGPIVGTVHGSKGREARTVVMTVRDDLPDEQAKASLEGRVLYVGLSRAKEELKVAHVGNGWWGYLESRRVWRRRSSKKGRASLQLEVGRVGDVDTAYNPVALDEDQFTAQQHLLARFDGVIRDLVAKPDPDDDWRWYLRDADESDAVLGVLSRQVNHDLWEAIHVAQRRDKAQYWPWGEYRHLRLFDVTTVAVHRDHQLPVGMPEPWRSTRVWLSPVISGLASIPLNKRKKR